MSTPADPDVSALDMEPIKARLDTAEQYAAAEWSTVMPDTVMVLVEDDIPALIAEVERLRHAQEPERWALMLPEGVNAIEAKSLTTGRILSDADAFQWVKAADLVLRSPRTPQEPEGGFIEKVCPFCGENDFDAWGLKFHLSQGGCDVYNETTRENRDGNR